MHNANCVSEMTPATLVYLGLSSVCNMSNGCTFWLPLTYTLSCTSLALCILESRIASAVQLRVKSQNLRLAAWQVSWHVPRGKPKTALRPSLAQTILLTSFCFSCFSLPCWQTAHQNSSLGLSLCHHLDTRYLASILTI